MFTAYLQIILSYLLFASSAVFARWIDLPVPLMMFYRFLFPFLTLFLLLLVRKEKLLVSQILRSKSLVIMGVMNTALAFSLFMNGIKKVKAQHVGVLSYSEPIFATIYAFFLFLEIPTISTIIGGILIIIGGCLVIIKQ